MTTSIQLLGSDNGIVAAEVGPLCIVIWRGSVTQDTFNIQRDALAQVVKRHPGKAGFLCIIEPGTRPPDDELRRQSAAMITGHGAQLRCVATVIEGSGFSAALTRTVLSGIGLLAPNRQTQVDYFANLKVGLAWLAPRMDLSDLEGITAAVEKVRATLK